MPLMPKCAILSRGVEAFPDQFPKFEGFRLANRPATVLGLLGPCSPARITRFIRSVVVNTLNCKPFRGHTHISKEVTEAVPSCAYRDTSAAVVFISWILGVKAPAQHIFVRLPCFGERVHLSVFAGIFGETLPARVLSWDHIVTPAVWASRTARIHQGVGFFLSLWNT